MSREDYIPTGAKENCKRLTKDDDPITAYQYTLAGKVYGLMFIGRRQAPFIHQRYQSEAELSSHIALYLERQKALLARKSEARAARMSETRSVKVGDILYTSWGYEQTNIDFYEVTDLVGKTSVILRKVASSQTRETGHLAGYVVADKGAYCGDPFRVLIRGDRCTIDGHSAKRWNGQEIYESSYY